MDNYSPAIDYKILEERINAVIKLGLPIHQKMGNQCHKKEVIGFVGGLPEVVESIRGHEFESYDDDNKKYGNINADTNEILFRAMLKAADRTDNEITKFTHEDLEIHMVYDPRSDVTYSFLLPARKFLKD